jgi:hypothetical protein
LAPIDGSLLIEARHKGEYGWRAKHPTVLDAFASLVAENRELMDIYLTGTPVSQLLTEVACGVAGIGGVKVEVPLDRYDGLIRRIEGHYAERRDHHDGVHTFLAHRCGATFLKQFLRRNRTLSVS